jgi:hypothetical protein
MAGSPEVAEHLAANHFDEFGVIAGGVFLEGVVHALDGATVRAWSGIGRVGNFSGVDHGLINFEC